MEGQDGHVRNPGSKKERDERELFLTFMPVG